MKNSLPNTLASLALFLLLSTNANATIDSGRQYSSTRETKGSDELTSRVNQVYRLYLIKHTQLSAAQKKQLKSDLTSVYKQLKNQPGPASSWQKLVTAVTGSKKPGSENITSVDSGELKEKKKFLSFLRLKSKPVLNELNAIEKNKEDRKPKRYEFKLFKWVE